MLRPTLCFYDSVPAGEARGKPFQILPLDG
jgi:hypothetical protein